MRKIFYILVIILASISYISCNNTEGSGNALTEWREINNFEYLSISGAKKVTIIQGDNCGIKITADDNIIKSIVSKVVNQRLIIAPKRKVHDTNIELEITAKTLSDLEFDGKAEVLIQGKFLTHNLEIRENGSGKLVIENLISDKKIKIISNGKGTAKIKGKSQTLLLKTTGAGSLFAKDFVADTIGVKIEGSGSVFVNSNNILKTKIIGSGNVIYTGNPVEIDKKISGSGIVIKE